VSREGQINACFAQAVLIWPTSTSYDHKRDLPNFQIEFYPQDPIRGIFSNGQNFGPSIAHEV
jgi:hypothetical protein